MRKVILVYFLGRFGRSTEGATAIEYGLIAACIALVIIGSITMVGTEMSTTYNDIATAVQDANQ